MGRFLRDNCPTYLKPDSFKQLKAGGTGRLDVRTGTFLDALRSDHFTKARPAAHAASWACAFASVDAACLLPA